MRTVAGELGYGTGEGRARRGELAASQFLQSRRRADRARGCRHAGATRVGRVPPQQFPAPRPGVQPPCARQQRRSRRLSRRRRSSSAALIERQSNFIWRKKWTWSYGADLIATDERGIFDDPTNKETRTFLIAALPLSLGYDGSDDLLDPTKGFRLGGRISPEISAKGGKFTYGRVQIDASVYHPVSDGVVAAGRVRLGTIIGASPSSIAPSRRTYSGGGGSVRGYGYQELGPARRVRRPDRRPRPGRVRARGPRPAQSLRRQFRDRPVPRWRHFDDGRHCRTSATGSSARASASAIIRASARSGSMSERRSIRERATAGRGHRVARPGFLKWRRRSHPASCDGRAALSAEAGLAAARWSIELACPLVVALLFACRRSGCVLLDTAPGHRFIVDRIGAVRDRFGLRFRIGRIDGSIFGESRLKNVAVSRRQRECSLTSPEIDARLDARSLAANELYIDNVEAERLTLLRLPKLKPTAARDRSSRASTSISAICRSSASSLARRSPALPEPGRCTARPTFARGRAVVDLSGCLRQGWRPARDPARRGA